MNLSHTQLRILAILSRHWRWWAGGSSWKSFDALSKEINRPLKNTRDAVRDLADKGFVNHQPMVNDDGIPNGSGYFLTVKAEREL